MVDVQSLAKTITTKVVFVGQFWHTYQRKLFYDSSTIISIIVLLFTIFYRGENKPNCRILWKLTC